MSKFIITGVVLLSLTSWPLSIALSQLSCMKIQRNVFITGAGCFLAASIGTFFLFRRYFRNVDPMIYLFSLFCYDALCGLGNALELDGYIPSLKSTNLTEVEPYLKTAHGTVISYWNGIVHFILCLSAIGLYTHRDSHREVSLYWAGSLINSMVVLLPGCFTGSVKISTYFNSAFVVLPIVVIFYYIHHSPLQARTFLKFSPIWKRPIDLFFLICYIFSIAVAVFRGLAVLGGSPKCMTQYLKEYEPYLSDPSNFPKFQVLTYEYIFLVYYLFAIYGLLYPGQHWMADWSLIHAGASAQAQFSYIYGSLHPRTPKAFHSPQAGNPAIVFWGVNLALFVIPHLFAWWCQRDPENYGRTYTVDLATPKSSFSGRSVRYQKKRE
ncbi:unnamed protein product [Lymnaea stagnalis]|uniref:EXPERA domain-containing protein n=1 Tax=Lymnaea stagnalis TaxID=6523 RepID=A0AAV2HXS5_LYMST